MAADRLTVLLSRLPGRSRRSASTPGWPPSGWRLPVPLPTLSRQDPRCIAQVTVRTLGRFEVYVDGSQLLAADWQSRKARDLLRILAARRGRAVPREQLGEMLWPAQDPGRVGHRLSVALSTLRACSIRSAAARRTTSSSPRTRVSPSTSVTSNSTSRSSSPNQRTASGWPKTGRQTTRAPRSCSPSSATGVTSWRTSRTTTGPERPARRRVGSTCASSASWPHWPAMPGRSTRPSATSAAPSTWSTTTRVCTASSSGR
ncbi:hypothetical protein NKG94_45420 [Micromonospora sp. M12]